MKRGLYIASFVSLCVFAVNMYLEAMSYDRTTAAIKTRLYINSVQQTTLIEGNSIGDPVTREMHLRAAQALLYYIKHKEPGDPDRRAVNMLLHMTESVPEITFKEVDPKLTFERLKALVRAAHYAEGKRWVKILMRNDHPTKKTLIDRSRHAIYHLLRAGKQIEGVCDDLHISSLKLFMLLRRFSEIQA